MVIASHTQSLAQLLSDVKQVRGGDSDMKKSKIDILMLAVIILLFIANIVIPVIMRFQQGFLIVLCLVLFIVVLLIVTNQHADKHSVLKKPIERIGRCIERVVISIFSVGFYMVYTLAIFNHPIQRLSLLVSITLLALFIVFLFLLSIKNKALEINQYYAIKNIILSAVCFGVLPVFIFFASSSKLESEYFYSKYFADADAIQTIVRNTNIKSTLDNEIFDITNNQRLSRSVRDNKEAFLTLCQKNEFILSECTQYQIHPEDIYDYYVTFDELYNRFTMRFIVFGFSTGALFFCLYHSLFNNNRTQVLVFGICIATLTFFSNNSDGAVIYWLLKYLDKLWFVSSSVTIEDVSVINEMLIGISAAFSLFIAVDRVYRKDTPNKI